MKRVGRKEGRGGRKGEEERRDFAKHPFAAKNRGNSQIAPSRSSSWLLHCAGGDAKKLGMVGPALTLLQCRCGVREGLAKSDSCGIF